MYLVLRKPGDQRHYRSDNMRRLERPIDRDLAFHLVETYKTLAGFKWAWMHALVREQVPGRHFRLGEGGVSQVLVADLPVEDVIAMFARAVGAVFFVPDILAQHRRIRVHRLERINDYRQLFI